MKNEKEELPKIENIRVCIRMRPLLKHEDGAYWEVDPNKNNIYTINYFSSQELDDSFSLSNNFNSHSEHSDKIYQKNFLNSLHSPQKFNFDRIYSYNSESQIIYKDICQDIIKRIIEGYNGSIFMYGQTTSGKTFTMLGTPNSPGILPCSLNDIFILVNRLEQENKNIMINIYCSYIEIYNEKINDLLNNSNNLKLVDDKKYGTIVSGAKRVKIKNFDQGIAIKDYGEENRNYRETLINEYSSRSHCIFQIYLEQFHLDEEGEIIRSSFSCLNLVDLAGSERVNEKENKRKNIGETGYINKSLFMLTNVINKLAENSSSINKKNYIPYRDSKLTRLLSQSLGGNSLTTIICTISPATMNYYQTLSTLRFAIRAKCVRMQVNTNEYLDDKDRIYYYQKEIKKLKDQLRFRDNKKIYNINNNLNYDESFGAVSQFEYNKILNAYQSLTEELENYKRLYKQEKEKSERYKAQINGQSTFRIDEENENEEVEDEEEKKIINNDKDNNILNLTDNNNNNISHDSDFRSYKNFKLLKKDKQKINNGGMRNNFNPIKNKIINKNSSNNNDKDEYEQLKKFIRYNRNKSYKDNLTLNRINSYDTFKKLKKDSNSLKTEIDGSQDYNDHSQLISQSKYNINNNKNSNYLNDSKFYLTEVDTNENNEMNYNNNNIINNKKLAYIKRNNKIGNDKINDNSINGNFIINKPYYDKDEETINAIKNGNVFNMLDINYNEIIYNNNNPKKFEVLKKLIAFKIDALEKTMDYYKSFIDEYYKNKINEINNIQRYDEMTENKKRVMIMNVTDEYKNILNKLNLLYKEKREELEYNFSIFIKNLST